MPALASSQLPREVLQGWLGVNLRLDGLTLSDQDVMRAINVDFHRTPGVIRLRAGRTLLNTTDLGDAVRTLARHNTRRYQVSGGTLYRDFTSILTGLNTSTSITSLVPSRPLNDTTTWSFIADQNLMRKDDGTTVHRWGIVAPGTTPTLAAGGAGSLSGAYRARYTYARVVGSAVAHENNPCPAPTAVTLASQTLSVPVVASSDSQVTHIRVYRTAAGGTTYLFDQQVSNTTATITSSQADSALGTALETDNDPPPEAAWTVEFQGHLFLCIDADNPHYLWYSKRFRPESWPTNQFLELGSPADPLRCAVPLTGLLGVFSRQTKYRVLGNAVSGFVGLEALSTRGTPEPNTVAVTSQGTVFVARDGLFLTNFVEADLEISHAIQGLFNGETINEYAPVNWDASHAMSLAEYKRRLWFGYRDTMGNRLLAIYSLDTQRWYHYEHPVYRLLVEEDTDQLTMGSQNGFVYVLEDSSADSGESIALSAQLPVRAGGNRFLLKRFDYVRVEATVPSGTLTITVYVDDVLRHTLSITGTRVRTLRRLPQALMGYTYQFRLAYTGTSAVQVFALEMLMLPLEQA